MTLLTGAGILPGAIVGLAMPLTVTYAISYEDAERQVGDFEARRH
ncbi:hypothetical protein [Reyranella soli]|jgi:hypothetical protein|uniref:Uncharacterized protein n=1 Tax=Reyranella soli TaxID=1230389 RepID=A0A512NRJ4_9HYPH|nr:hypothetical protein [Reyranella soli]GEP61563.1 hypothetical protein RSO01_87290 [Reyranella soli]